MTKLRVKLDMCHVPGGRQLCVTVTTVSVERARWQAVMCHCDNSQCGTCQVAGSYVSL